MNKIETSGRLHQRRRISPLLTLQEGLHFIEFIMFKIVYVHNARLQREHGPQPAELEHMLPQVLEHRSVLEIEIK
jgi:hypothetical protein